MKLSRRFIRLLRFEVSTPVEVTPEDGRLVLAAARPRYTVEQLTNGMNVGDIPTVEAWDTTPARGRESW